MIEENFTQAEAERLDSCADAYSGIYNDENIRSIRFISKRIFELADNKDRLLELGLGDGETTSFFAKNFNEVHVIEGSLKLIDSYKSKFSCENVNIIHSLFEEFETEEKFSNIALCNVLEHVVDPEALLKRFKKLLEPYGNVFIAVPNATSLNRQIGHKAGLLNNIYAFNQQDINLGHRRYFDKQKLLKLLAKSGYKVTNIEGIYLKPITTGQMNQLNFSEKIYRAILELGKDYPELSTFIFVKARVEHE
jgi:2-polyprenyl-3-methyl-5-hydroxy-6-metoxy-1,4-benzoquinol methylase